jgi:hypothetical protein
LSGTLIIATSSLAYLNVSAQNVSAQNTTAVPNEYFWAQINTAPDITAAPLFRSADQITINLTNYQSTADMAPVAGAYTCTFEARTLQDRDSTATAWTALQSNVAYNPTSGCSTILSKTQRGNGLNWSFRVTVTSTADATLTHAFFSEYALSFQGAGIASGG